jgi:hypothetical protein
VATFGSNIRSPGELETLLKDLDGEIDEVLIAERVHAVYAYGWIDHDEADPDYLGHTLWQTDPPFQPDFSTLSRGWVVGYAPSLRDELLTRNGEDFEAVMIAARRAMGMALVRGRSAQSTPLGGSDEFWQDYSISTMLLAIASDRLRDFLVMATENVEYDGRRSEKDQRSSVQRAIEKIPGLAAFAMQSPKFKKIRNEIVHQIATQPARTSVNTKRRGATRDPKGLWKFGADVRRVSSGNIGSQRAFHQCSSRATKELVSVFD